jgi:hypothetical protein
MTTWCDRHVAPLRNSDLASKGSRPTAINTEETIMKTTSRKPTAWLALFGQVAHKRVMRTFALGCTLAALGLAQPPVVQGADEVRSSPKDSNSDIRKTVPEDLNPPRPKVLQTVPGNVFIRDVVVANTDPTLNASDTAGDGETSIAINPTNPNEIGITAFSGGWGANAVLWHSTNGGVTWTRRLTISFPPGNPGGGPNDQAIDFGIDGILYGGFLSCTSSGNCNVYGGSSTDPTSSAAWTWVLDGMGNAVIANFNGANFGADQPWTLANIDPFNANQVNTYIAYDDFGASPVAMRVAVARGTAPPNFVSDVYVGDGGNGVNPGLRLANDPRTGFMWALWQFSTGGGAGGSRVINYNLNRSIDGGQTWTLNGSGTGITIATADSTQPDKFGTVNALLGGVDHAAVDPNSGDVYYVYGNRDAGTGNNRLAIRRITSNGAGGVNVGGEKFVTGQVQAAVPSIAVASDGTLGVFYYTFDGFSADNFPIFTAHFALSDDHGDSFKDIHLLTFLSAATNNCPGAMQCNRQRVLGDYHQTKTVGRTFYGAFTANGASLGRPVANHDAIFFKLTVGPVIQVQGATDFGNVCIGETKFEQLNIFNSGTEDLIINSITRASGSSGISVEPTPSLPTTIAPGEHLSFTIRCRPTAYGSASAVIRISSNDPDNPQTDLTYTCTTPEPDITTAIANSGNFGNVCVGSFKDLNLTINNSGGCDLLVTNITSNSGEFIVPGVMTYPIVIHAGDSVAVPIRFQPTNPGAKAGLIAIGSNDPQTPSKVVAVSGTAPTGDVRITGSTDFGDVCAGTLAEKTVSICNVGLCDLRVSSVSVDCPDFTIINNAFPANVSHDFCLGVVIRFTPTSCGPKTCTLTIVTDDPDSQTNTLTLTANTPCPSIDVPPDMGFLPEVIQTVGTCKTLQPFPISNKGKCLLTITDISIGGVDAGDYSLSGLPSFPILLEPGHIAGEGDLNVVFAPTVVDRDREATITVTYVIDPILGTTAQVTRKLCGEGVRTGARVLVTHNGIPVAKVERIQLQRINANRNRNRLDSLDNSLNLTLQTVVPAAPCPAFQYHREYGTVSNPVQLLPGAYQVTATAIINGKRKTLVVGFDLQTCDFNPAVVVDF